MKHIRKRLTYANVMSSLAVFLVIGGGAAFAAVNLPANSVGTPQLKRNAVKTGKVAFEAIRAGKLSKNAVPTNRLRNSAVSNEKIADGAVSTGKLGDNAVTSGKLANDAVTTDKIANDAVTGDKVKESTLGEVPNAANSQKLQGKAASEFASAAQGIKGAFAFNDGVIELSFNAINGGAYGVVSDNSEATVISTPFSVQNRVAVVSGSTISYTGGQSAPFPRCIYTLENVSNTSFRVNHVNADAAGGCDEEWSILIF